MKTVSISSKNQITLPSSLLKILGLKKGHSLLIKKNGNSISLTPTELLINDLAKKYRSKKRIPKNEIKKQVTKAKLQKFKKT